MVKIIRQCSSFLDPMSDITVNIKWCVITRQTLLRSVHEYFFKDNNFALKDVTRCWGGNVNLRILVMKLSCKKVLMLISDKIICTFSTFSFNVLSKSKVRVESTQAIGALNWRNDHHDTCAFYFLYSTIKIILFTSNTCSSILKKRTIPHVYVRKCV